MATLILWAAITCIPLIVLSYGLPFISPLARRGARSYPRVVVSIAFVFSVAAYICLNYEELNLWGRTFAADRSFLSDVLQISDVRNALFGTTIATLAYLWLEQRRRFHTQFAEDLRGFDKFPDLHLVLLTVVILLAVLTAELPGILRDYKVSVGPSGISLEARDEGRPAPLSSDGSNNQNREGGITGAHWTSLDFLGVLTGSRHPLQKFQAERDASNVCALTDASLDGDPSCEDAKALMKYNAAASKSITPVFNCLVEVAHSFRDRALITAFIRPLATAYMLAVFSEDAEKYFLNYLVSEFEKQVRHFGFDGPGPTPWCIKAVNLWAGNSAEARENLREVMDSHKDLPYGHIAYAIFAEFFGDPVSGVMTLERWYESSSKPNEDKSALWYWKNYVARTYQNLLVSGISDPYVKVTASRYKFGARRILQEFSADFLSSLDDEGICSSGTNETLLRIYHLHIQEAWTTLMNVIELNGREGHFIFRFLDRRETLKMEAALSEYGRLFACFQDVFWQGVTAQYYQALIEEALGGYKLLYSSYVRRREADLHPEGYPETLCGEAKEHFELALSLWNTHLGATSGIGRIREDSRMADLGSLFSGWTPNRDGSRLRGRLDVMLGNGGCS